MTAEATATIAPVVEPWIPEDNFRNRLGLVRVALGGLNIKEAAELCGLSAENWRRWEDGGSPRDLEGVCWQIHERTGLDYRWLIAGGTLSATRTGSFSSLLLLPEVEGQTTLDDLLDAMGKRPELSSV